MAEIIAGELMMECLAAQGPAPVLSIPDGTFNIIFKWAHDNSERTGMRFITPRHEACEAHIADAWSRVSGSPAIVVGGAGPGAANLISGVITAACEDIPMIVITTSRRTDLIGPERGAMQVFDQPGAFGAVCKFSVRVLDPTRIPAAIEAAYIAAITGIPGPAHIDIPENILNSAVDASIKPIGKINTAAFASAAPADSVEEAAKIIAGAKELLIHCGATVVRSGAWSELVEIAEYLGAAVTTTPGGRGAIPEDHPNSFLPVCGPVRASLSQADVILAVGCKFGELDFFGKPPLWGAPGTQKLVHIHRAPERIGMNKSADVPLIGDAPIVLRQLIAALKELTPAKPLHPKIKTYRDIQKFWDDDLRSKHLKKNAPLNTGHLVTAAREFFDRDAIMVMDGGNTTLWNSNMNRFLAPRTMLWTSDFGHLGTGIPYAVGAKLAAPEKNVCLISGDSAFGFNMQEIETARRENLPFTTIVAVDGAWGMEKTAQERCFGHKEFYVNCEHHPIRYDRIAEAMDCFGAHVTTTEEILPALEDAVASGKPAIIHADIDPLANVYPPGVELWVGSHKTK